MKASDLKLRLVAPLAVWPDRTLSPCSSHNFLYHSVCGAGAKFYSTSIRTWSLAATGVGK